MNSDINKTFTNEVACGGFCLKSGLLPMLLGIAALGSTPAGFAADECGPGPTVICTAQNYGSTGVTYDFSSDFAIELTSPNVGAIGLRLNGSGDADLNLTTFGAIFGGVYGAGGIQINLENGDLIADIHSEVADVSFVPPAGGAGLRVSTGGSATILLRGATGQFDPNFRLTNLVMDVGRDSKVTVQSRRTVQQMMLSPSAGATLTIRNEGGVLGADNLSHAVTGDVYIRGAGAGHLIIDNTGPRGRIASAMDFTGMTGQLTILNDHSGNQRQGGWQQTGVSLFGSGNVKIRNGRYGVLRTDGATVFDFSDTSGSHFYNEGRVMVGTGGASGSPHLNFVGLDRFENAGLILMGTDFSTDAHAGLVTDGRVKDRLTFQDSNYVGVEGGRIALDVALGGTAQADCSTLVVADCVQFTGNSTTGGVTLLDVTDITPLRSAARFNAGITLIEGASAAEHFVLDPASQFYVGHTSAGPALQKGLVAYSLHYDAGTEQHRLVGALADEAAQAATLGAAAHEAWRLSTDTWFDRQAAAREAGKDGFNPQGLWFTANTARGDRSLRQAVDFAGTPITYNLSQDQDISHLAFGMDLLQGGDGEQTWTAGATVGLLHSSIDYEATQRETSMTGLATGLYGGWMMGGLSIDGMLNLNYLRQIVDGTHLGQGEHNQLRTQVKSNGVRFEAGWKLPLSQWVWLQPLLGASYVTTDEGDLILEADAGGMRFDSDARSLRLGAGLRAGIDSQLVGLRTQYRLTGRYWNERDAENEVVVDVPGQSAPIRLVDGFSGNFSELDGSLSLSNDAGSLSGYVSLKGKFGDDYRSVGGSAGLRYQW
jgi:hypothetical protein